MQIRRITEKEYPRLLKFLEIVNIAPEEYFYAIYSNDPYDSLSHSLVVEVDGEIASHIRFFYRPLNGALVPFISGAIANVGTLENQRLKGYCRSLLETSIDIMKQRGYDYSTVLSGVPVYAKCGWEEVKVPGYTLKLKPVELKLPDNCRVRRFCRDTDLEQLHDIYLEFNHLRPLSVDRTRKYWLKHLNWTEENGIWFIVVEKDNMVTAYMRGKGTGENVEIFEMAHRAGYEDAYLAIIQLMSRYIGKCGWKEIKLNLPADHEFLNIASQHFEAEKFMKRGLLVKLINLKQILTKLQYLFQDKLNSLGKAVNAGFMISCDGQKSYIDVKNGVVKIKENLSTFKEIKMTQQQFFSLIFHLSKFSELNIDAGLNPGEIQLLDAIFDGKKAVYWGPDQV